jgi:PEP-CTERM motif
MRNLFRSLSLGAAAMLLVALTGGQTRADIILLPGETAPVGGVGHTPESILSIQSPKNTENAFGKVAWNGSKDVISGEIAKQGEHTKTLSFAQAGITNAGQLRIFMDIEDPDNDLILHEMTLTAYGTNGAILFQGSFIAGPQFFSELGGGQGHGDYVFGLDATQAAQLQAAFQADPNLRLGLFARTSDDTGSFTNFKLGQGPEAVPEPTTMLLFGTGIAGIAARARRRRKQAAKDESSGKV